MRPHMCLSPYILAHDPITYRDYMSGAKATQLSPLPPSLSHRLPDCPPLTREVEIHGTNLDNFYHPSYHFRMREKMREKKRNGVKSLSSGAISWKKGSARPGGHPIYVGLGHWWGLE